MSENSEWLLSKRASYRTFLEVDGVVVDGDEQDHLGVLDCGRPGCCHAHDLNLGRSTAYSLIEVVRRVELSLIC